MAFITVEELKTHLYGEQVNFLSREDDTIPTAAIDGAISEAKGYLGDYDKESIFKSIGDERHALLLIFIKDIAVWHLINIDNPGTNTEQRHNRYKAAIGWLKGVQKGDITPDLPKEAEELEENNSRIISGSNPQRNNHF